MNMEQQLAMSSLSTSSTLNSNWHTQKKPLLNIIIPDDVLVSNLFIRLPAKQLAQMRSLSKTWNHLLSHPSFIESHLDRSKDTNDAILMVFDDSCLSKNKPLTAYTYPSLQLNNSIKVHNIDSLSGSVVGAVNGLICLEGSEGFKIWNPSLSALIALPPFTIGTDDDNHDKFYYQYNFRFGFDPKTSDYKVVKLTYNVDDDGGIYNWFPMEVFSVIKCSWESITGRFPSHIQTIINKNEVVVNGNDGRLHYLCLVNRRFDWFEETIVTFDLGDETFSEISLPDWVHDYQRENELGFLSQKLCVMSRVSNGDCEVWVMEKYGVANSWVKRYVVPKYDGDDIVPIGFTLDNQLVFGHGVHLALYGPESLKVRRFKGARLFSLSTTVVQYVDSLVWPVTLTKCAYKNDVCNSSSQIEKKQDLDD